MHETSPELRLRALYEAEDGFLIRLRVKLHWDRAAFKQLVTAMQDYVESLPERERIDRWAAELFWYLDTHVGDWIAHENFPKVYSADYYRAALERLGSLAHWLFLGYSMYEGDMTPFSD